MSDDLAAAVSDLYQAAAAKPAPEPRSMHLRCPRCGSGLGIARSSRPRFKKTCKRCLDQWRVSFEPNARGIEITWELLWSKWPIPKSMDPA